MTHRALSLALFTVLSLAAPAFAQAPTSPPTGSDHHGHHGRGHGHGHGRHRGHGWLSPEGMEHRLAHLTEALSLDEHQVTLIREILESARTEARAAMDALPEGADRHAARHTFVEGVMARIDAVLNDEQRATFARLREERRSRREARRARHDAAEGI